MVLAAKLDSICIIYFLALVNHQSSLTPYIFTHFDQAFCIFIQFSQFRNSYSCTLTSQEPEYLDLKPEYGENNLYYPGTYLEGEDGELSWFNAGVRVGVGIGLSICVGVGIGVGLLVRTYQGTTQSFRRRLL